MPNEIIIALIGLAGSGIGSVIGVVASAKLTNYRLEQLEKKVEKHNNLVDKMYRVENTLAIHEAKLAEHEARATEKFAMQGKALDSLADEVHHDSH